MPKKLFYLNKINTALNNLQFHKGKGKTKFHPESYRPISILPAVSKVIERIIQKQLSEFLTNSKQLNQNQHSYKIRHSTTTAIAQIVDNLFEATDRNLISALLSVDQSATFDTVSHDILIKKLKLYNFDNNTTQWFTSYLKHRTQCVSIGGKMSSMEAVTSGVPQGSVLGPILYALYTNELPIVLKQHFNCQHVNNTQFLFGDNCQDCGIVICYADDTTLVVSSNSRTHNQSMLEQGLNTIEDYLTSNHLSINRVKTTLSEIMIGQKRAKTPGHPPSLIERDHNSEEKVIYVQKDTRLLGATLQDNMSWSSHLENGADALLPEARQKLGILKHIGVSLPYKSRKLLTEGLVVSKLRYLIPLWGGTSEKYLRHAQVLLNDAARFVCRKVGRRTSSSILMSECSWLSIKEMTDFHSLTLMWNTVRTSSPKGIAVKLTIDNEGLITSSIPRLQHTTFGFRWRTSTLWNQLSREIRCELSLPRFKTLTKRWILAQRADLQDPG